MHIFCQDLVVRLQSLPLLREVSFAVNAGQLILLAGPNGIGKTTLLQVLRGAVPIHAGVLRHDPDAIAFIGLQTPFFEKISVRRNLEFWSHFLGAATQQKQKAHQFIEQKYPLDCAYKDLSQGQQQWLNLSRLLLTQRACWLLDEPMRSLDSGSKKQLLSVFLRHLEGGGSIVAAVPEVESYWHALKPQTIIDMLQFVPQHKDLANVA